MVGHAVSIPLTPPLRISACSVTMSNGSRAMGWRGGRRRPGPRLRWDPGGRRRTGRNRTGRATRLEHRPPASSTQLATEPPRLLRRPDYVTVTASAATRLTPCAPASRPAASGGWAGEAIRTMESAASRVGSGAGNASAGCSGTTSGRLYSTVRRPEVRPRTTDSAGNVRLPTGLTSAREP